MGIVEVVVGQIDCQEGVRYLFVGMQPDEVALLDHEEQVEADRSDLLR